MSHDTNEELLSAYLDGELSANEQQRVEQLIAEQDEARQALEELRSLRETLQSFPRRKLGDGFSDRVLDAAQQHFSSDGGIDPVQRPPIAVNWRRFVWAGAAIAAALMLMFLTPDDDFQSGSELAQRPENAGQELGRGRGIELVESDGLDNDAEPLMRKGGASLSPAEGSLSDALAASPAGPIHADRDAPPVALGFAANLEREKEIAAGEETIATQSQADEYASESEDSMKRRTESYNDDSFDGTAEDWLVRAAAEATESDLVVQLDYYGGSPSYGEFDQVLVNQSIAVTEPNLELVQNADSEESLAVQRRSGTNRGREIAPSSTARLSETLTPAVQFVLVDASAKQVLDATDELRQNRSDFRRIRIQNFTQNQSVSVDDSSLDNLAELAQDKTDTLRSQQARDIPHSVSPHSSVGGRRQRSYAQRIEIRDRAGLSAGLSGKQGGWLKLSIEDRLDRDQPTDPGQAAPTKEFAAADFRALREEEDDQEIPRDAIGDSNQEVDGEHELENLRVLFVLRSVARDTDQSRPSRHESAIETPRDEAVNQPSLPSDR